MQSTNGVSPTPKTQAERHQEFPDGHIEVMRWARIASLSLPPGHRPVLLALAYFANLEGLADPSQETLAYHTGKSRTTVSEMLRDIESLGFIRSRLKHDKEGYWKEYLLAGSATGWTIDFPEDDECGKPIITQLCERLEARDQEIEGLKQQLAGLSGENVVDQDGRTSKRPEIRQEEGEEEEENERSLSSSTSKPSVPDREVWFEELRNWVADNFSELGWKDPGAAFRTYSNNPERLEVDKRALELTRSLKPAPTIRSTSPYFKDLAPKEKEKYLEELQFQREMGRDNKDLLLEGETGHLPDPKDTSEANDDPDVKRGPQ